MFFSQLRETNMQRDPLMMSSLFCSAAWVSVPGCVMCAVLTACHSMLLLLHVRGSWLSWFRLRRRLPPGCLPVEIFMVCPTGRETAGQTQNTRGGLHIPSGLWRPENSQEAGGWDVGYSAQPCTRKVAGMPFQNRVFSTFRRLRWNRAPDCMPLNLKHTYHITGNPRVSCKYAPVLDRIHQSGPVFPIHWFSYSSATTISTLTATNWFSIY